MMLVAIACGKVFYDNNSHILYRIHDDNAVGVKKLSLIERIGRLKRYFVLRDDANIRMITAQELLRLFSSKISKQNMRILMLYSDYQKSWKDKMAIAFDNEILNNCLEKSIVFRIKVITNFV